MTKDSKAKILIVDDDKFLLDMYSLKFTEEGFDVTTRLSSEDAFENLKDGSLTPDVVLLDMVMPTLDGIELLKKIREENICRDAFIIVLSNLGEPAEIEKAKKLGIDGYIVKASLTPSEVVERVVALLYEEKRLISQ